MKKTAAILITLAVMLATFAAVSMNRTAVAQSPSQQSGIWVSGEGTLSVPPDVAMLDFGVDVFASDFNTAHYNASFAMNAVITTLKARGVGNEDIRATKFSIQPVEDEVEGRKVLVGYRISNNATAKLRDTSSVGIVIGEMIAAGGGSARINGISFALEDPNSKRDKVLALAVKDAEARAKDIADLYDVEVGQLIHISEGALTYTEPAALAGPINGPISGGDVKLSLSVEAAFAIVRDGTPMPTATPTSEPTAVPTPTATPDTRTDDELTRDYVERAIARYDRDGRESAFAYYNSRDSLEGVRSLFLFEPDTFIIWVTLINPAGIGIPLPNHGEPTAFMKAWIAATSETGEGWFEYQSPNPLTGQNEPKRGFGKRHDGFIFISSHSILQDDIGETTKNYVNKAIKYYDDNGRQATIDHYNDWEKSRDGFFYLFLMDENDIYLAHPIRKDLIGTDIKNVVGRDKDGNDGYELGKEIAKADENGIWVNYLWPNPVTGLDESKTTWAIRHEGLIFASGYYKPLPEHIPPACLDADPREYTEDYVNRAIKRYEEDGLKAMVDRYDSVASYECNWYLFATDADDKYIVHPFKPALKGTDIKDLDGNFTDVNGNPLGTELAKAGEGQGVWVEYLWPHPATTKDAKKVAYAVRKDGMIFASGYYPAPKDQPAHVQNFVQDAIDVYKSAGLDEVKNIYGTGANSEGLWFLQVLDENAIYVVHGSLPQFVGLDARTLPLPADLDGNPLVPQVLAATADGVWLNIPWPAVNGPENLKAHLWVVKHDGYFFGAAYYDSLPFVRTNDEMTRDYVKRAINYYDANGRDATIAHYSDSSSVEGERMLYLIDTETLVIVASPIRQVRGVKLGESRRIVGEIKKATEQGHFHDRLWLNFNTGQQEPTRFFTRLNDGLVFMSGHLIVKENVADTTKEYINRATKYYDDHGVDAMVAHYNTRESFDGQLYLFMMDENDIYLVHPFIPRLIGTDIKDLPNKDLDGNPLGVEIAKATEAGIWVEYMWPNPLTLKDERKVTWAIRHDGKIFASGYYTGRADDGTPPWATIPPRQYTEQYVNQVIERYKEFGLESVKAYYNSVASFEGEFYLFGTDPNDIYIIHPLLPHLIGTDIKDVVDTETGFELGKELAKATNEEGVWVEYNWPHPKTGRNAPKVSYAKRHDGYLFATGYYPLPEDPEGATKAYIQGAIDLYESDGLDAMVAYYNSKDSIDGQWHLYVIDQNEKIIVSNLVSRVIGKDIAGQKAVDGAATGLEVLKATAEGHWFSHRAYNILGTGELWLNAVAIRHDSGLIFVSGYHTPLPQYDVPD